MIFQWKHTHYTLQPKIFKTTPFIVDKLNLHHIPSFGSHLADVITSLCTQSQQQDPHSETDIIPNLKRNLSKLILPFENTMLWQDEIYSKMTVCSFTDGYSMGFLNYFYGGIATIARLRRSIAVMWHSYFIKNCWVMIGPKMSSLPSTSVFVVFILYPTTLTWQFSNGYFPF